MKFVIIRIILLVSILLNLQFISTSTAAHNLINANAQDKVIFEWCIPNTESYLNYKFEDLEVYYSNTYKEYREILLKQQNLSKDKVSDLVRTSYACGIWDTNKIFLNKSGLSINKQKEILEKGDMVVVAGGAKWLESAEESKIIGGIVRI